LVSAASHGGGAPGQAFQFRVVAYDPYMPNGTELGVGVERVNSLEALMERPTRCRSMRR